LIDPPCCSSSSFLQGKYFKLAKWHPEWIEEAIRLTREMWETHYKPAPQQAIAKEPNACPKVSALHMQFKY
jgi:hypothetical protein